MIEQGIQVITTALVVLFLVALEVEIEATYHAFRSSTGYLGRFALKCSN